MTTATTTVAVDAAADFLWRHGRLLERRRFTHRFDRPDPDGVAAAVLAYRNPDGGFGQALNSALSQVNEMQARSSAVTEAYERGETTDIASVMLARQQASIGFEATMQVRNKLLSAYRDIMNMPV